MKADRSGRFQGHGGRLSGSGKGDYNEYEKPKNQNLSDSNPVCVFRGSFGKGKTVRIVFVAFRRCIGTEIVPKQRIPSGGVLQILPQSEFSAADRVRYDFSAFAGACS